ncbi:release factor glutamine methyltransferase [Nocardia tenerifensis]|uniref:Release factor glutamine methyltransferase n=1 Tax=Nocardia tenerifensis TaxID=228006 RepID=A0A318JW39_9NOCA|nr:HemK2/MTQ2 family protein methyltransferase [Nocardia tenerifensis]PXX61673.1 release factor glutamine methyltransferase [Nocardia tenerifensis]
MLIRTPGVYRPQTDTWLLAAALAEAALPEGGRVVDVCSGTGALAVHAGLAGAASVTAVDISGSARMSTWLNCRMRGIDVEILRGDFEMALADREFDLLLANPPYVPARPERPVRGRARAWHAGRDGRSFLDRLCARTPTLLAPDGAALIVHSTVADPERTITQLRRGGLKAAVVARATIPFGPVMRRCSDHLVEQGLIQPDQRSEELVVIRADKTRK